MMRAYPFAYIVSLLVLNNLLFCTLLGAVLYRLSALALYEAGEVAPRTGSFSLGAAHTSCGGGLRLGLSDEATLRCEVAKSVEGLHASVALGSDF